jgi:biotin carboxyl carrier protein
MRFSATADGRTLRVEVRGRDGRYTVLVDGKPLEVDVVDTGRHFASLLVDGRSHGVGIERRSDGYRVHFADDTVTVGLEDAALGGATPAQRPAGPARLTAPMPGRVVRVLAEAGREVEAGEGLVVVEAMKMENELRTPRAGRVTEIAVREGQTVETGALLVVVT